MSVQQDTRTEADKAYDAVRHAQAVAEQVEDATVTTYYYDPVRICRARAAVDAAIAHWRQAWPEAAAAMDAKAERALHIVKPEHQAAVDRKLRGED